MTLAADTRAAVRDHPFLLDALRAGVVNHAAAARLLGVDGDVDAVATALRRFADRLPESTTERRDARVTMKSGLAPDDSGVLSVNGRGFAATGEGDCTGLVATGEVDARSLEHALARLRAESIGVEAAGVADGAMVVVVGRRSGAAALRAIEDALAAVPGEDDDLN